MHLRFTHDNKGVQRTINVNPKSREFINVIECFMQSAQVKQNEFFVQHIEKRQNHTELPLYFGNIDDEDCKIKIEVDGENTTCKPRCFIVGLRDKKIKMLSV